VVESSGSLRDADLREEGVRQYGRVDPVAILTLILGFFGCLTVPIFGVWVPIPLAVVCGIAAIKRIRGSGGGLVGTPLVIAGMVLWTALLAARYYYDWSTEVKRKHAITEGSRMVNDFFGFLHGGHFDDAHALLSDGGKKRYGKGLAEWKTSLDPLGKFQDVQFVAVEWERDIAGEEAGLMWFNVRFEKQALMYIVTMVQEDDDWLIADIAWKTGVVEKTPAGEHSH